jgi:hypothetical protein
MMIFLSDDVSSVYSLPKPYTVLSRKQILSLLPFSSHDCLTVLRLHLPFLPPVVRILDPTSSAILQGSGMKKSGSGKNILDHTVHILYIREFSINFLGLKIRDFVVDPGSGDEIS